jgi:hypothetical protein
VIKIFNEMEKNQLLLEAPFHVFLIVFRMFKDKNHII